MYERLDYLLSLLRYDDYRRRRMPFFSQLFNRAGYGLVDQYLQKLIAEGYIEQEQADPETFRLTEKGALLHYSGGFVHKAESDQERRSAIAWSLLTLVMTLIVLFIANLLS